ncbi:APC family permease, partial [Sphingomonas sp.]|jgi:amino acid transporter|uniref:APC family permease n=1 Tax=Sphingomonas sp. TaxID=28214 RepID=UPI00261B1ED3
MVGAGIFALLGQAVLATGRMVIVSLLISGTLAMLSGASMARLAAKYPERGGLTDYLKIAFPRGAFAAALSLVYVVTLVIGVAVVSKSFGAYAALLFFNGADPPWLADGLAVLMIIGVAALNLSGAKAVGRTEEMLVAVKIGVLVLLIVASLASFDPDRLMTSPPVGLPGLTSSVLLTFFAFTGFGMMATASASVANPQREMPRAIIMAIVVVTLLYVALALVILGNLSPAELQHSPNTAVADAARPVLGQFGFTVVSIGGLLATASSTNASFFSILNLNADLVQNRELPRTFTAPVMHVPFGFLLGLVFTVLLILGLRLDEIANVAGMTFLIAYLAVFAAHWRLHGIVGGSRLMIIVGALMMLTVLAGSIIQMVKKQPSGVVLLVALLMSCAATARHFARLRSEAEDPTTTR